MDGPQGHPSSHPTYTRQVRISDLIALIYTNLNAVTLGWDLVWVILFAIDHLIPRRRFCTLFEDLSTLLKVPSGIWQRFWFRKLVIYGGSARACPSCSLEFFHLDVYFLQKAIPSGVASRPARLATPLREFWIHHCHGHRCCQCRCCHRWWWCYHNVNVFLSVTGNWYWTLWSTANKNWPQGHILTLTEISIICWKGNGK